MIDDYLSRKIKILSLFAIIAVVYIHANNTEPRMQLPDSMIAEDLHINSFMQFFITNGLARVAVPLFFCISGYLFFHPGSRQGVMLFLRKIATKLRTIVVPFLIWSFIGLFLTRLMLHIPFYAASAPYPEAAINAATLLKFVKYLHRAPISYHLWFLVHLFGLMLFGYPIFRLLKTPLVYAAFAAVFYVWVQGRGGIYFINPDALLFFMLGGFLAVRGIDMNYKIGRPWALAMLSTWVLLVAIKTVLAYRWSVPSFHQLTMFLGFLSVWFCYDHLMQSKQWLTGRLEKIADHTFFIYAAHAPFLSITTDSLLRYFGNTSGMRLACFVLVPSLFIAGLVLISSLLRKAAPAFYGVLTGGRGVEMRPRALKERVAT
jgi:surface polysaccharide O-acyltransferase-like enzyme